MFREIRGPLVQKAIRDLSGLRVTPGLWDLRVQKESAAYRENADLPENRGLTERRVRKASLDRRAFREIRAAKRRYRRHRSKG